MIATARLCRARGWRRVISGSPAPVSRRISALIWRVVLPSHSMLGIAAPSRGPMPTTMGDRPRLDAPVGQFAGPEIVERRTDRDLLVRQDDELVGLGHEQRL